MVKENKAIKEGIAKVEAFLTASGLEPVEVMILTAGLMGWNRLAFHKPKEDDGNVEGGIFGTDKFIELTDGDYLRGIQELAEAFTKQVNEAAGIGRKAILIREANDWIEDLVEDLKKANKGEEGDK